MDQPILLGNIIDGYRLEELLGRGSITAVYHARAQQLCLVTELTVTVISLPESFSPQMRTRFLQRFQHITARMAKVRHPLLLALYGFGEYNGSPYLFTPDTRGETLKSYMLQSGHCTPEDALRLVTPIVQAFEHLHAHGMTYRFFDPSKVLLLNKNVIQIIGLGLDQILCLSGLPEKQPPVVNRENIGRSPDHLRSIDGSFLGVPFYLAPEVLLNKEPDPRSDIYSLGVLLFEMLSGRLPFPGQDYLEVVRKSLLDPVPSLRSLAPGCSEELERLVLRAMQRDPERRFQSVDEFLAVFASVVRQGGTKPNALVAPKRVSALEDPTIPRSALESLSGPFAAITHEPLPVLPPKEQATPSTAASSTAPDADLFYELPSPFGGDSEPLTPTSPPPPETRQSQQKSIDAQPRYPLSQATMFAGMRGVFEGGDLVKESESSAPQDQPASPWENINVAAARDESQPQWGELQLADDSPSAPLNYRVLADDLFSDAMTSGPSAGETPPFPSIAGQQSRADASPGKSPANNNSPFGGAAEKAGNIRQPAYPVGEPVAQPLRQQETTPEISRSGEWAAQDSETEVSGLPPGVLEAQGWSLPSGAPSLEQRNLVMAAQTASQEASEQNAPSANGKEKKAKKASDSAHASNPNFNVRLVLVLASLIVVTFLGAHPFVQPRLPAPPVPTVASTAPPPEIGGMCTATPAQMKYLPSAGSTNPAADWTSVGGSKADYVNAQACAAQFLTTYLSFDIDDPKSLEASVYMLSVGAKKRFYNHDSSLTVDYMDPIWRASAQKHRLSQTSQTALPALVHVSRTPDQFLAWMTVHCKVQKKTDGTKQTLEYDSTVLLNKVLIVSTSAGTGWQVSAWHNGSIKFPPPNPI